VAGVELEAAEGLEHRNRLLALAAYYLYDLSAYLEGEPGWRMPESGRFPLPRFFMAYWDAEGRPQPGRHAFLIRADGELSGFALLRTGDHDPDLADGVDVHMAEFFVTGKKRRQGVGRAAVHRLMARFPGRWEVMQLPRNLPSIAFWEATVRAWPIRAFRAEQTLLTAPSPHLKILMTFDNPGAPAEGHANGHANGHGAGGPA